MKNWKKNKRNIKERSEALKAARDIAKKIAAGITLDKEFQEKPLAECVSGLLK